MKVTIGLLMAGTWGAVSGNKIILASDDDQSLTEFYDAVLLHLAYEDYGINEIELSEQAKLALLDEQLMAA